MDLVHNGGRVSGRVHFCNFFKLLMRRELLKDAIYMATKAVDKYSRRGYKERQQEGSCCAESFKQMSQLTSLIYLIYSGNLQITAMYFCIIFVGKDVSAFDDCQLKFIT